MRHCLCILLFFLSIFSNNAFSETADSLADVKIYQTKINYFFEGDFIYGKAPRFTIDTSITHSHLVNPLLDLHYNYLSTANSAGISQTFSPLFNLSTFTSTRSYDLLMLSSDSMRYFQTNKRFTEIKYHSGNFEEQSIQVFHTQNIMLNWNAGLIFDRQGVNDFMNFSDTFRSRFALFTWYASPNKRYNVFAHGLWNSFRNAVNGGLTSDSLFDNTIVNNLGIKGLAYQISEAQEKIRKKSFMVSQYYDLGKITKDSAGNILHRSPSIRLHDKFSFERKSFVYSDPSPDSSFYSDYYYGAETYDSLHSDEITNRFSIQLPSDTSYTAKFLRNWSSGVFVEYQHVNYGQRTDTSWENVSAGANIFLRADSALPELFAEGKYVASGFDQGNYLIDVKAYSPSSKYGRLGLLGRKGESSPDMMYRWYEGNNFSWRNKYSPVKNLKLTVIYELKKYNFSLSGSFVKIDNFVCLAGDAYPIQFRSVVTINQLTLIKNFTFRKWHFDNNITWQKSDNLNIIPLPDWVTNQSFYYVNNYFGKALLLLMGISANFNSTYYSNAFMPANSLFYLQNTTKTGGYLRLDLFINAEIKTARIFLKLENAFDDLFENSYYLTPHYPMPGRVIKFGLAWRFLDQ